MPSVPKYFRAMFPRTRKRRCFNPDDRSIAQNVQNKGVLSAGMGNGMAGCGRRPRKRLDYFLYLLAGSRRRLRHVDRIGGRKAVLETLLQPALELAFTRLLAVALGFLLLEFVLHDALFRNCHAWRAQALLRTNNALAGTGVPGPVCWLTDH